MVSDPNLLCNRPLSRMGRRSSLYLARTITGRQSLAAKSPRALLQQSAGSVACLPIVSR